MGGPNLLRSQLVLNDQNGELIVPVVAERAAEPGHAVDAAAAAAATTTSRRSPTYIHSVMATTRGQGAPPAGRRVELNIVVGDAKAGQAYFATNCASCHSRDRTCRASRRASPSRCSCRTCWVGGGGGRGGRGRGGGAPGARSR